MQACPGLIGNRVSGRDSHEQAGLPHWHRCGSCSTQAMLPVTTPACYKSSLCPTCMDPPTQSCSLPKPGDEELVTTVCQCGKDRRMFKLSRLCGEGSQGWD